MSYKMEDMECVCVCKEWLLFLIWMKKVLLEEAKEGEEEQRSDASY